MTKQLYPECDAIIWQNPEIPYLICPACGTCMITLKSTALNAVRIWHPTNRVQRMQTMGSLSPINQSREKTMLTFHFDLKPLAKQSVKFTRSGITYQPKDVVDFKCAVRFLTKQQLPTGFQMFTNAIDVEIWYLFQHPKSMKASERKKVEAGHMLLKTTKPDVDNLTKPILDALNGVVWEDDGQVAHLRVGKYYCPVKEVTKRGKRIFIEPKVNITISFESLT